MSLRTKTNRRGNVCVLLFLATAACATGSSGQDGTARDLEADSAAADASANTDVVSEPKAVDPGDGASTVDHSITSPGLPSDTPLTGPTTYFIGRVDMANPKAPLMGWPGTQVVGGFTGSSIGVKLRDGVGVSTVGNNGNNYFDISIDNGNAFVFKLDQNVTVYPIADRLADANHVIRLTKRTENKIGLVAFDGFIIDGNHTSIPTPTPLTRKIEFLGDSGAAGYGADGVMPCVFSAATENAAQSYPLITARRLNAIVNDVAYSGKGLYQNRDPVNDPNKTLPVLWHRMFPDAYPVRAWNPNNYIPDVMVMVLSGNDFGASVPQSDPFIAKVKPFILEVRASYPTAPLFIMISPLLQYPNRTTAKNLAQGLIDAVGDPKFSYIDIAPETGTHGWGCDNHLTGAAAAAVADQLVPVLQQALGW